MSLLTFAVFAKTFTFARFFKVNYPLAENSMTSLLICDKSNCLYSGNLPLIIMMLYIDFSKKRANIVF